MMFMTNESRGGLSSMFECVHAHADLTHPPHRTLPGACCGQDRRLHRRAPRAAVARAGIRDDRRAGKLKLTHQAIHLAGQPRSRYLRRRVRDMIWAWAAKALSPDRPVHQRARALGLTKCPYSVRAPKKLCNVLN